MICKFIDIESLDSLRLGDEKCICFIKVDMAKYDLDFIHEWVTSLSVIMPNVQWCLLPHDIELEFCCKEDALRCLDALKEKINEE